MFTAELRLKETKRDAAILIAIIGDIRLGKSVGIDSIVHSCNLDKSKASKKVLRIIREKP